MGASFLAPQVTNGEFLRFVKAGGYSNARFWSVEGWGWRTFRNVKWPTFWIPNGPQGLHKCVIASPRFALASLLASLRKVRARGVPA